MEYRTMSKKTSERITGTSYMGEIRTDFQTLVKEFGVPYGPSGDDKIAVSWVVNTLAGVATIYNYKDGKNYDPENGKDVEDITEWHIGGRNRQVLKFICRRLGIEIKPDAI